VKHKDARLSELIDGARHAYPSSLQAPCWRIDDADMAEELLVLKGHQRAKK
jgi:hypothetical protein